MTTEIYLDNNATTLMSSGVKAAIRVAMDEDLGNPSSEHRSGEKARRAITRAKDAICSLINTSADHLVFGSGATELSYWALLNAMRGGRHSRLVTSPVEHSCILQTAEFMKHDGVNVDLLEVDQDGQINLDELRTFARRGVDAVSIQWVNNETGVIQPIQQIAEICAEENVPFHCDAAQALGKVPIDLANLNVTYLTVSAHKMHGPSGIGAIYATDPKSLRPLFHGGSQESGYRPGTENLLGIIGFGMAADERCGDFARVESEVKYMRDSFEEELLDSLPELVINGSNADRAANSSNITFSGVDGSALVALLDRKGIRCSQSSACTSNIPEPSYVLRAMGRSEEEAFASVRFSFSNQNTMNDVLAAVSAITDIVTKLRGLKMQRSSRTGALSHEV